MDYVRKSVASLKALVYNLIKGGNAMRQVVARRDVTTSEATDKFGYIMVGNKGNFMLAKDAVGHYIWVRLCPPKVTQPARSYSTLKEALEDKVDQGYEVVQVEDGDDIAEFLN